jgi:hypothetical protein
MQVLTWTDFEITIYKSDDKVLFVQLFEILNVSSVEDSDGQSMWTIKRLLLELQVRYQMSDVQLRTQNFQAKKQFTYLKTSLTKDTQLTKLLHLFLPMNLDGQSFYKEVFSSLVLQVLFTIWFFLQFTLVHQSTEIKHIVGTVALFLNLISITHNNSLSNTLNFCFGIEIT